jgi:transcriptional regulator with XRE-family HTH domain
VLRGSVVRGQKNPLHHGLPLRLRKALKQAGLTRTGLARLASVSHPIVLSLESRKSLTIVSTIARLAAALGVASSWLAYGIGEQTGEGTAASCDGMDERLRTIREVRGHTRTTLARLAEVTPGTIIHIEGGGQAKVNTVESLAQALGVSPAWLAFGIGLQVLPSRRRGRPPAQADAPAG